MKRLDVQRCSRLYNFLNKIKSASSPSIYKGLKRLSQMSQTGIELLRILTNRIESGIVPPLLIVVQDLYNYYSFALGTNSIFKTIPIPSANRFNKFKEGFLVPFSNLLISA